MITTAWIGKRTSTLVLVPTPAWARAHGHGMPKGGDTPRAAWVELRGDAAGVLLDELTPSQCQDLHRGWTLMLELSPTQARRYFPE